MHREIQPPPAPPLPDPALPPPPTAAPQSTHVLHTHRLSLRHLTLADAPFILSLLNDASWLRYIGDRNVHSLQDAERYLRDGPFAMHSKHGYSLWAVTLAGSDAAIGMCGLLKRDSLRHADVGYAFLPEWRAQGFAREAAAATLQYARDVLGMKKIVAVCSPDNARSIRWRIPRPAFLFAGTTAMLLRFAAARACVCVTPDARLLQAVGMRQEGRVRLTEGSDECSLFAWGQEE
jgi:[ribosomal protein S5]-alanine N-acetyltransferase